MNFDTSPNAAYSPDAATKGSNELLSATVTLPAGASQLAFKHRYVLEAGYDGGVLEIKIGAGAFADILTAGGTFVSGGYTTTLASGNAFGARQAWSGTNTSFTSVVVNLPAAAAGQNVQFRWRCGTDTSVASAGWWVDSVAVSGSVCCGDVTAPIIQTQPQSQSVNGGASANFSVTASGTATLAYQWYFNSNAISGATATNYFLASCAATNVGNYFVVITNLAGSMTSSVATLTVVTVPVITQSPASQTVTLGQSANFSVAASGAPTLIYQWRKAGTNLLGANATNYFIAAITADEAGSYDVVVTNSFGSVTSAPALLTAANPAAYGGILVAWETTGLSGYGPSPFAAISNAPNVTVVAGWTRGSGVGTVPTAAASAWGGTGFGYASQAAAITGNSYVSNIITAGVGYTISFTNIPTYNIRHSGTGSTTGIWQYQVGAGAFTDIGSAITWGATTSGAGNTQSAIDLSGIAALQNVSSGVNVTFRLVLWGGSGGTWYFNNITGFDIQLLGTLAPVNLGVTAPTITVPPVATNVFVGKNAGFTVAANGTAPLAYQWLKNGSAVANGGAVSGALTNALNFTPTATNHTGNYSVIVTNLGGAVTSAVVGLNVVPLPELVLSNSGSGFVLAANGGAISNTIIVQRATNLVPPIVWVPLQTNVIGTNGQIRFTETNANLPASFYRIQIP